MDAMQAIRNRKSTRAYNPEPLSRELVTELLQAAIMAPSGSNAQPWKFYVVTGDSRKSLVALLRSCMGTIFDEKTGVGRTGVNKAQFNNALFQFISENNMTAEAMFNNLLGYYDAPVIIFLTLDDLVRENTLAAGAAVQNILLAACERGLGTCWITFPFMRSKSAGQKIKQYLNIPGTEKIVSSIAIGYPDERSPLNAFKSARNDIDSFVEWIGWV